MNAEDCVATKVQSIGKNIWLQTLMSLSVLRGNCTPDQNLACFVLYLKLNADQNLACFVLYLKIIKLFWKMIYASYSKLSKELKNGIEI